MNRVGKRDFPKEPPSEPRAENNNNNNNNNRRGQRFQGNEAGMFFDFMAMVDAGLTRRG